MMEEALSLKKRSAFFCISEQIKHKTLRETFDREGLVWR
jgi:hypothetical protein